MDDWEKLAVLFVCFGIASAGFATSLYALGFLIKAMTHG
jgi:hypothetical protein